MNKGFTLIELLAVLLLLGVIAVIAVFSGMTILKNSKENLYNDQVDTIERAAKNYQMTEAVADNATVTLNELASKGYLDSSDLTDPRDKSKLCGNVKITYDNSKNQYYFKFQRGTC